MKQMEKQYEGLGLENNFIFGKVMKEKSLCIGMLECLTGNQIDDINEITVEKHIKVCANSKGVRYDVFIEDNLNRIYDPLPISGADFLSLYHLHWKMTRALRSPLLYIVIPIQLRMNAHTTASIRSTCLFS